MAKSRNPGKNISADELHNLYSDSEGTDELFEHAFAVVDASFSAALISGISPQCLRDTLSYGFLNVASTRRDLDDELHEKWLSEPDLIWEPVLSEVLAYIESFKDEIILEEIETEVQVLLSECNVVPFSLSELEERRHNTIAYRILEWTMDALARQLSRAENVELALLAEWFKIGALTSDCAIENYAIVRYNAPKIQSLYNQVM